LPVEEFVVGFWRKCCGSASGTAVWADSADTRQCSVRHFCRFYIKLPSGELDLVAWLGFACQLKKRMFVSVW